MGVDLTLERFDHLETKKSVEDSRPKTRKLFRGIIERKNNLKTKNKGK